MSDARKGFENKGGYPGGTKPVSSWKPLPASAIAKPKPTGGPAPSGK